MAPSQTIWLPTFLKIVGVLEQLETKLTNFWGVGGRKRKMEKGVWWGMGRTVRGVWGGGVRGYFMSHPRGIFRHLAK